MQQISGTANTANRAKCVNSRVLSKKEENKRSKPMTTYVLRMFLMVGFWLHVGFVVVSLHFVRLIFLLRPRNSDGMWSNRILPRVHIRLFSARFVQNL